jgi:glycosyltransferase involved in cell wall biosynthesis
LNLTQFNGKLALQQRVMTAYRAPFFDELAQACTGGLSVCAGLPRLEESIVVTDQLQFAEFVAVQNSHLLKGPFYLCYQRGLTKWLERGCPDALIVEANPRYLATPGAVRWMKRCGKPVIGWGLGAQPPSGSPHFFQKWGESARQEFRIAFLRRFDAMITYSRRGADEYARLGFPTERIFVAPNAVAGRPSQPMPTRPTGFTGKPVVLFVGRLQARKRIDLLLQACAALPSILRPHLIIVGDGPERNALEALAKTVYPAAEFSGAKHGAELADYFCKADLFRSAGHGRAGGTGGHVVRPAGHHGAGGWHERPTCSSREWLANPAERNFCTGGNPAYGAIGRTAPAQDGCRKLPDR